LLLGNLFFAEDWDAECQETSSNNVDRPVFPDSSVRPRNQGAKVFYNKRFNSRQHEADDKMNRQDEARSGMKELNHSDNYNNSSDSRESGVSDDRRPTQHGGSTSDASPRGFNHRRFRGPRGRGRGTVWEDTEKFQNVSRPPNQNGYYRERRQASDCTHGRKQTSEQCEKYEASEYSYRQSQSFKPNNHQMPNQQCNSRSPEVSAREKSHMPAEKKPDARRTSSLKGVVEFYTYGVYFSGAMSCCENLERQGQHTLAMLFLKKNS
jgi:hypothetical protein